MVVEIERRKMTNLERNKPLQSHAHVYASFISQKNKATNSKQVRWWLYISSMFSIKRERIVLSWILGINQRRSMWKCAYVYSVVEGERQEERQRERESEKRFRSFSYFVIRCHLISLWDRQTQQQLARRHSHRMGDDRNQLVPGSTGDVNPPCILVEISTLFFVH
jgi:hypothetical protein